MHNLFTTAGATAFASTRAHPLGVVGVVSFVQGSPAVQVVHECLRIHDDKASALRDARRDARKLLVMWGERVRLGED